MGVAEKRSVGTAVKAQPQAPLNDGDRQEARVVRLVAERRL
jgi:hypothetical protein